MIPDSAKTSSDVSVSILNGRKKTSKKKKASSLSSHAILPTNDIKDLFKGEKKKKKKKKRKEKKKKKKKTSLPILSFFPVPRPSLYCEIVFPFRNHMFYKSQVSVFADFKVFSNLYNITC